MTEDELTDQQVAEAADYYTKLNAQRTGQSQQPSAGEEPYTPPNVGAGPKDLAKQVAERAWSEGDTQDAALGQFVAASAAAALRGDARFIYKPPPMLINGQVVEQ